MSHTLCRHQPLTDVDRQYMSRMHANSAKARSEQRITQACKKEPGVERETKYRSKIVIGGDQTGKGKFAGIESIGARFAEELDIFDEINAKEKDANHNNGISRPGLKTYLDGLAAVAQGHVMMSREVVDGKQSTDAEAESPIRSEETVEMVIKRNIGTLAGLKLDDRRGALDRHPKQTTKW